MVNINYVLFDNARYPLPVYIYLFIFLYHLVYYYYVIITFSLR